MNNYLFNFSSSYKGGGLKRLVEFLKYFDRNGGAFFIIHPNCRHLINVYKNNYIISINKSLFDKLIVRNNFINQFIDIKFDLYYSYGIPISKRFACVNLMHVSNILPFATEGINLSFFDLIKMKFLYYQYRFYFKNADIVSAESAYSIEIISTFFKNNKFISINGSDDELKYIKSNHKKDPIRIAVSVGTYKYKSIRVAFDIFKYLNKDNNLIWIIIGSKKQIPDYILNNPNVIVRENIKYSHVIRYLRNSMYYISATQIENSFNAASEGLLHSQHSILSSIPPHLELVGLSNYYLLSGDGFKDFLVLNRNDINYNNLQTWESIILDILFNVNSFLNK